MNTRTIEDFAQRYGAKIDLRQDRISSYNYMGTASDYLNTRYYDTDRNNVEISLSMRSFEHLLEMDNQAEEEYQKHREEARIRMQYPAVADAYHKYKMLLELCK